MSTTTPAPSSTPSRTMRQLVPFFIPNSLERNIDLSVNVDIATPVEEVPPTTVAVRKWDRATGVFVEPRDVVVTQAPSPSSSRGPRPRSSTMSARERRETPIVKSTMQPRPRNTRDSTSTTKTTKSTLSTPAVKTMQPRTCNTQDSTSTIKTTKSTASGNLLTPTLKALQTRTRNTQDSTSTIKTTNTSVNLLTPAAITARRRNSLAAKSSMDNGRRSSPSKSQSFDINTLRDLHIGLNHELFGTSERPPSTKDDISTGMDYSNPTPRPSRMVGSDAQTFMTRPKPKPDTVDFGSRQQSGPKPVTILHSNSSNLNNGTQLFNPFLASDNHDSQTCNTTTPDNSPERTPSSNGSTPDLKYPKRRNVTTPPRSIPVPSRSPQNNGIKYAGMSFEAASPSPVSIPIPRLAERRHSIVPPGQEVKLRPGPGDGVFVMRNKIEEKKKDEINKSRVRKKDTTEEKNKDGVKIKRILLRPKGFSRCAGEENKVGRKVVNTRSVREQTV